MLQMQCINCEKPLLENQIRIITDMIRTATIPKRSDLCCPDCVNRKEPG